MTAAKLIPALALGMMLPLFAQTNAVNVDQVVTLSATLSSLNVNPPMFSTPSGSNPNTATRQNAAIPRASATSTSVKAGEPPFFRFVVMAGKYGWPRSPR